MSSDAGGLVRRRVAQSNNPDTTGSSYDHQNLTDDVTANNVEDAELSEFDDTDPRNVKLNLMEEVFLLGLKDKQGYTSFWNDCISAGLRGCILAELVLRKRIALEKSNKRKINLYLRKVQVINNNNTGDALLDEALKHINDTEPRQDLYSWIHYFSGEYEKQPDQYMRATTAKSNTILSNKQPSIR